MKSMQQLVKVPEMQKTMMEMSKEMMKVRRKTKIMEMKLGTKDHILHSEFMLFSSQAGIMEEMLEDTLDDALETDELEDDMQEEVDKVLDEIMTGKVGEIFSFEIRRSLFCNWQYVQIPFLTRNVFCILGTMIEKNS